MEKIEKKNGSNEESEASSLFKKRDRTIEMLIALADPRIDVIATIVNNPNTVKRSDQMVLGIEEFLATYCDEFEPAGLVDVLTVGARGEEIVGIRALFDFMWADIRLDWDGRRFDVDSSEPYYTNFSIRTFERLADFIDDYVKGKFKITFTAGDLFHYLAEEINT